MTRIRPGPLRHPRASQLSRVARTSRQARRQSALGPPCTGSEAADRPKAKKKTRAARRFQGIDNSKLGADGLFTLNRKGLEVCSLFNQGRCGSDRAQGKCKSGRAHQCNGCLGPHTNFKCPQTHRPQTAGWPPEMKRSSEDGPASPGPAAKKRRSEAGPPTEVGPSPSAKPVAASSSRRPPRGDAEEQAANMEMGYGHWTAKGAPSPDRPMALILFSGRPRPGDLAESLNNLGWLVCSVDTAAITPTNVLIDTVWSKIERDIGLGMFDCIWLKTPSSTFSPLRNSPAGPKPLRSVERIQGLPDGQLRPAEQKQLKEANLLVNRSVSAAEIQLALGKPWGWESPDHGEGKVAIWKMPNVWALRERDNTAEVNFDQCRTGLTTVRPTKLLSYKLDFSSLDGIRCNHVMQKYQSEDGFEYTAAHESVEQKWVPGPEGKPEKASRAQSEYTPKLCGIIAAVIHQSAPIDWRKKELAADPLP